MRSSLDQIGNELSFDHQPKRIVSLVPSITELIADLVGGASVVGCTKFCIHPKGLKQRSTIVGGTKTIDIEQVSQLNPDLIIANKEENPKDIILELGKKYPVWVSDVKTLSDSYEMTLRLGDLLQCIDRAHAIVQKQRDIIDKRLNASVAYLIWQNPYMTVGGDTYIHDVLATCGFSNIYSNRARYPETDLEEILSLQPELVFLSFEPFPFADKHKDLIQEQLPNSQVCLVDGEFFSWYGSRLLHKSTYLSTLHDLILNKQ